jgi:hypothetical protein
MNQMALNGLRVKGAALTLPYAHISPFTQPALSTSKGRYEALSAMTALVKSILVNSRTGGIRR